MAVIMILLNLVHKNHPDIKYAIFLIIILYDLLHFAKFLFGYQPIEQILFILS